MVKVKKAIESAQKFALKVVNSQWDSSYDELLQLVNLKPLEERRMELRLGLLSKIIHKLCFFPEGSLEYRNFSSDRSSHSQQLYIPLAHTNSYFYSLFPHTSSTWNMLDENCVSSQSYLSFMRNLRH